MAKESKRLRYIGPIDEISIPALGVSVKRNHQVEVEDEDKDVANSLLEQADWEEVGEKKRDEAPADPPKKG